MKFFENVKHTSIIYLLKKCKDISISNQLLNQSNGVKDALKEKQDETKDLNLPDADENINTFITDNEEEEKEEKTIEEQAYDEVTDRITSNSVYDSL